MQSTCSKHGTPVSISTRTHFSTVQITTIVIKQFNFYWHEKSCVNMETDFLALHTAPIQDESKGSKSDRSSPCISPWTLGRVSIQCLSFVLEAFAFLFQATESYTYLPIIWMCSAFNVGGLNIWFWLVTLDSWSRRHSMSLIWFIKTFFSFSSMRIMCGLALHCVKKLNNLLFTNTKSKTSTTYT